MEIKGKSKNSQTLKIYESIDMILTVITVPLTFVSILLLGILLIDIPFSGFPFLWSQHLTTDLFLLTAIGVPSLLINGFLMIWLRPTIDRLKTQKDTITPLIENYDQIIEILAHREADEHRLHISRTELELMVDLRVQIEKAGYTFDDDMRIVKKS